MEWLIGLFIIWVLWKLLTGRARREAVLKKVIEDAFVSNPGKIILTKIYWEAAEQFAQDRGAETNKLQGGGHVISFNMLINHEEVTVTISRDHMYGTANISVENAEQQKKRIMKQIFGEDV